MTQGHEVPDKMTVVAEKFSAMTEESSGFLNSGFSPKTGKV
jgi:hypothetical protein